MSLDFSCDIQMVGSEFGYNYGVGDIFLAHFGSLSANWASIKRLSIVADHVHPFMTTVYPSSDVLPAG